MTNPKHMVIGPQLERETQRGDCPDCGGQCSPECGSHPMGCIFGGTGRGYWLYVQDCPLDHGQDSLID